MPPFWIRHWSVKKLIVEVFCKIKWEKLPFLLTVSIDNQLYQSSVDVIAAIYPLLEWETWLLDVLVKETDK